MAHCVPTACVHVRVHVCMHANARMRPSSRTPTRTPEFQSALHAAHFHGHCKALCGWNWGKGVRSEEGRGS